MAGALIGFCVGLALIFITRSVPLEMQGSIGLFLGWAVMCVIHWWPSPTDPG